MSFHPRIVLALFILTSSAAAGADDFNPVAVRATEQVTPPSWAVKERALLDAMQPAARTFLDRYTRPDGTPYGVGDWDDVYEMFFNWSAASAVGGGDSLYVWARHEYDVLREYCTHDVPSGNFEYYHEEFFGTVDDGFPECDDWFHMGEGFAFFYDLGLCGPDDAALAADAQRFAGLYLNEEPGVVNFDPERRLFLSTHTGTWGPDNRFGLYYYNDNGTIRVSHEPLAAFRRLDANYASLYPVIPVLESNWASTWTRYQEVMDTYAAVVTPCDTPVNLSAIAMFTHAFLYTGDVKYRQWILDYVDAWIGRIEANGGLPPDNVGRSGIIGEYRGGQWWGGLFGWSTGYSIFMNYESLAIAAECAYLVSGDPQYLEVLRTPIQALLAHEVNGANGKQIPTNIDQSGWKNYSTAANQYLVHDLDHLWHASMDPEDWATIEHLRTTASGNWTTVPTGRDRGTAITTSFSRLGHIAGLNSTWADRVLDNELSYLQGRVNFIRNDSRAITSINEDQLYVDNPIVMKGLTQVALGAPATIYHGGLLRAQVRYFDGDRRMPGLPADTAALVESVDSDETVLTLVNLSSDAEHRVIVQAGAFGEHRFTAVTWEGGSAVVNASALQVELPPGTGITLHLGTDRFVNVPSYAFPWDAVSTGVGESGDARPGALRIAGIHPNPCNEAAAITVTLPAAGRTTVAVYSITGQKVATLSDGFLPAGEHRFTFRPAGLASGVYLVMVRSGARQASERLLYLK